jgi:hypothetical protein
MILHVLILLQALEIPYLGSLKSAILVFSLYLHICLNVHLGTPNRHVTKP